MSLERKYRTLARAQRALLWFAFLVLLWVGVVVLGEVIMRAGGRTPWRARTVLGMKIEPGGKLFRRAAKLGFVHVPGALTIQFPDGYTVRATHDETGLRATGPVSATDVPTQPSIWVFGCSFTYGMGLNDDETFPWMLQERFPEYGVVNFGQCGYGTLQSLIQLQQAFEERPAPRVAVLTYAEFHDERNTLLSHWRKGFFYYNTLGPLQQPYARLGRDGRLRVRMSSVEYKGVPFMRQSALVHSLEEKCDLLLEQYVIRSHDVSKALVEEFARVCAAHGVGLIVAGIDIHPLTTDILAFCRARGLSTVDIAVDFGGDGAFSLMPHDDHPNVTANRLYADGLEPVLREMLAKKAASVP